LSDSELHALMGFYPEPTMKVTRHPGKSVEDFKLEFGRLILAAYQKTIKGVLSLC